MVEWLLNKISQVFYLVPDFRHTSYNVQEVKIQRTVGKNTRYEHLLNGDDDPINYTAVATPVDQFCDSDLGRMQGVDILCKTYLSTNNYS